MNFCFEKAERQGKTIDALVLPEASIDPSTHDKIIGHIESKASVNRPILFIAGTLNNTPGKNENITNCNLIYATGKYVSFNQRKHHRWSLDDTQIGGYAHTPPPFKDTRWWESIQIHNRELYYYVFRKNSCLTTLICEDLARTDPCQSSIRSVGPNLLIALLMDGPQIKGRWPERYAMGLADDPGTSVLSVTSMGLIHRSNATYRKNSKTVALWKDCENSIKELNLHSRSFGLLLELACKDRIEETLDGRDDGGCAQVWTLAKTTQL